MSAKTVTGRALGIKPRRVRIAEQQDMRCYYCACAMSLARGLPHTATVDHMTPKSLGGSNRRANLVAACHRCNDLKGAMTVDAFQAKYPDLKGAARKRKGRSVRKALMAGDGRWKPDDRAGFRPADMGLDSPPLIGLAALWPAPTVTP
jgi:hypothetical protein